MKSAKHSNFSDQSIRYDERDQLLQGYYSEYDTQLSNHPLSLFFFIKKQSDTPDILTSLVLCLTLIKERQERNSMPLVQTVFVEEWVMEKLPAPFTKMRYTNVTVWPSSKSVASLDEKQHQTSLDYIITIGGDGTLLLLLKNLGEYELHNFLPPIITFSQGSLNYLGNFEFVDYEKILDTIILKGQSLDSIVFDQRMRLQIDLICQDKTSDETDIIIQQQQIQQHLKSFKTFKFQSLNEVSLKRNGEAMIQIEIFINDIFLTEVHGDGRLLIATPTGSTAYNLSCGGSIAHPNAQVICVTPIAPHSLSFRPIILPADVQIKVRIAATSRSKAVVTIDGHTNFDLEQKDFLSLKMSPQSIAFVRWKQDDPDAIWSKRLRKLLKWNQPILPSIKKTNGGRPKL